MVWYFASFFFFFSIPCVAIPFRMFSQMLFFLQVTKSTFICLEASKSRIFTTGWPTRQNMISTQPTTYRVVRCGKMLVFGALTILMRRKVVRFQYLPIGVWECDWIFRNQNSQTLVIRANDFNRTVGTTHAVRSMEVLRQLFPGHFSLRDDFRWPARSTDPPTYSGDERLLYTSYRNITEKWLVS